MRTIKAFMTCAAAVALTVVLTPSAYAADHSMYTADAAFPGEDPAGRMWFNEYGDVVTLCDNDADGEKPILHVALDDPYGADRYTLIVGGEGSCVTARASDGGSHNLPENRYIGFLICVYPDGYCRKATWYNDN
jgi:hypothetical protein